MVVQICFYIAENLQARMAEFADRIRQQTGRDIAECQVRCQLSHGHVPLRVPDRLIVIHACVLAVDE